MPLDTIVESCRVMIVRSADLTRLLHGSLISLEPRFSAMSRTMRPRDFSWSLTACLESASTSPLLWTPTRSMALKTYVLLMTTYAACSAMPSRRRSSSGVVDLLSASFALIWPERTSCARAVSIVCMPWFAPVCSDE